MVGCETKHGNNVEIVFKNNCISHVTSALVGAGKRKCPSVQCIAVSVMLKACAYLLVMSWNWWLS